MDTGCGDRPAGLPGAGQGTRLNGTRAQDEKARKKHKGNEKKAEMIHTLVYRIIGKKSFASGQLMPVTLVPR